MSLLLPFYCPSRCSICLSLSLSQQSLTVTWGRTSKKALKRKGLPANFKEWRVIAEDRSEWRSRTYSKPMSPSENLSYAGFMRVKMKIALRKWTLSPVRLVLEDLSKRSFVLFVVVSLQLGSII